jgi:hypothetical protein
MSAHLTRRLRCAVYTRKSTEEGLDKEYNSTDAQRVPVTPTSPANALRGGFRSPMIMTIRFTVVAPRLSPWPSVRLP